jgi:hypothetical protein
MFRLVSKTYAMPRSLSITDVEKNPQAIAIGGFGKVFKGKCGGQLVALKMLYHGHHDPGVRGFPLVRLLMLTSSQRIQSKRNFIQKPSPGDRSHIDLYFLCWEYTKRGHNYSLYHRS